jgi:hypothetical protein
MDSVELHNDGELHDSSSPPIRPHGSSNTTSPPFDHHGAVGLQQPDSLETIKSQLCFGRPS